MLGTGEWKRSCWTDVSVSRNTLAGHQRRKMSVNTHHHHHHLNPPLHLHNIDSSYTATTGAGLVTDVKVRRPSMTELGAATSGPIKALEERVMNGQKDALGRSGQ